jgi:putative DNA primase/helicase
MTMEARQHQADVWELIESLAAERAEGRSNRREEALKIAREAGAPIEAVKILFDIADAKPAERERDRKSLELGAEAKPVRDEQRAKIEGAFLGTSSGVGKKILAAPQPETEKVEIAPPAKPVDEKAGWAAERERLNRGANAKAEAEAKAKEQAKQTLAELGLIEGPRAGAAPKDEPEVAEANARAKAKAEPEADEPGAFWTEQQDQDAEAAVLIPSAPYDNAKVYARRFCFREGFLATYYWQEKFWQWNGKTYQTVNMNDLRASVYDFLDRSKKIVSIGTKENPERKRVSFQPKPQHVNELIDGLKAGLALPNDWDPPMWLDTRQRASEVLMFANGVLDIRTRNFRKPSPRLWVHGAAAYDWEPNATCPRWERFLEEIFPGDQEAQDFLEEFLGYARTWDLRFEKAALFVSDQPRTGKGTVFRVLMILVGKEYIALSFNNWVQGENSQERLIGKTAGVFPDVRLKKGKWYGSSYDGGGLDHASVELLLKLTSGDSVSFGRKYNPAWAGIVPIKIAIASNEVPNFNDPVLPTRFIKLSFEQSFLKREDVNLKAKLEAEITGIARRCMEAYWRACERGRFIQPKSGLRLKEKVEEVANPFAKFVREAFVIDPEGTVSITLLYQKFDAWCRAKGRTDLLRTIIKQNIRSHLRRIPGLAQINTIHPHNEPRQYTCLRLRRKDEKEDEARVAQRMNRMNRLRR